MRKNVLGLPWPFEKVTSRSRDPGTERFRTGRRQVQVPGLVLTDSALALEVIVVLMPSCVMFEIRNCVAL